MRPRPPSASPSTLVRVLPAPILSEHVAIGIVAAFLSALADVVVAGARGAETGALARAAPHLLAMSLPIGAAVGGLVGAALALVRTAPWLRPVRERLSSPGRLFGRDVSGFRHALALFVALGAFALGSRAAALHFATRYHDPGLASWAMAAVSLAIALGAVLLVIPLVSAALRPLGAVLGPIASTGTALILALLVLGGTGAWVLVRSPRLLSVYDPVAVAWLPGAIAVYLAVALASAWKLRRSDRYVRLLPRAAAALVAVTVAGLVASGATYGRSNLLRSVVEHRSVTGLRLVRLYAQLTDRDGDGHSFAFGGADCNDGDPNVHPGAVDERGDGIDADCFAGDGSPDVADFGDGAYGATPPGLARPNFLLVTVDALRPDHLGCYGYDRPTSPHIDRFAETAVRFDRATAQSSRSIRSVPSMRTGFYPSQIAYGPEYLWPTLEEENVTVEEVLADNGYRTAVTMGTDYFERIAHFFQGYGAVDQIDMYRPPRSMPVTRALAQLDRLERSEAPWLLWVHLFNVHEEYLWDGRSSRFGDRPIDAYDTEITLADREVGRLLDELDRRGLRDDTVVIVSSDHGEAFGEHGNRGHSFTLYDEELRVPLLIRVPGVAPRAVEQSVALFDLAPTLLNLAGVPVPAPMSAKSLLPLLTGEGRHAEDRLIFSEILPDGLYPYDQKAVRRGAMKLLWWVREGTFQLYDLEADPGETADLSDERPEEAAELLGLLRAWVAQTSRPEQRHEVVLEENRLAQPPTRMTRRLDARVGDVFTILGFDMPETRFEPGERIGMTFYYRVDAETEKNLFLYVDIKGPQGYRVPPHFHAHHYPLNGRYRTHEWKAGEILRDPVEMVIPEDIRHPVELRITFQVLDGRELVPIERGGDETMLLDLATAHVR